MREGGLWRVYVVSVEGEGGEDGTLSSSRSISCSSCVHVFDILFRSRDLFPQYLGHFSQAEIPQVAAYSIIQVLAERFGGKPVSGESSVTIVSFVPNASRV